jgi:predicted Zn-dependent protease with MMP-like domain
VQVGGTRVRLPRWRDRSGRFAALVHDEVGAVQRRWSEQLGELAVRVEDVPPEDEGTATEGVALVRAEPGVLVVYRRPVELRAEDEEDLADLVHELVVDAVAELLVHELVVDAVAELLGVDPDDVDPDQG